MSERSNPRKGKNILSIARFSRRQFLERVGVTLGGAAIGSIALASACKTETQQSQTPGTETENTTTPTSPATSSPTATKTTASVETGTTTATGATSLFYIPNTVPPTLIPVPNSSCNIATDRIYSLEHIWVKSYGPDLVALGITPSLIAILYEPYKVDLMALGTVLKREDSFGTVTGYKTVADLTMPVSGTVIQQNEAIVGGKLGSYLTMLNAEPFQRGWLVAVKINKPDELKDLMSPQDYLYRLKAEITKT